MTDSADPNLSLWKQGLDLVPTWVWERTELETLVLADNGLSDLSDRIGRPHAGSRHGGNPVSSRMVRQ